MVRVGLAGGRGCSCRGGSRVTVRNRFVGRLTAFVAPACTPRPLSTNHAGNVRILRAVVFEETVRQTKATYFYCCSWLVAFPSLYQRFLLLFAQLGNEPFLLDSTASSSRRVWCLRTLAVLSMQQGVPGDDTGTPTRGAIHRVAAERSRVPTQAHLQLLSVGNIPQVETVENPARPPAVLPSPSKFASLASAALRIPARHLHVLSCARLLLL